MHIFHITMQERRLKKNSCPIGFDPINPKHHPMYSIIPSLPKSLAAFTAAIVVVLLSNVNASAEVIYRETFGRPGPGTTSNIGPTNFHWIRYNTAGTLTSLTGGVNGGGSAGTEVGRPTDLANVNAGNNSDGTSGAYALGWAFMDGTSRLAYTPEYSFNPADYQAGSLTFSWYQGNNTSIADNDFRLALQIGGAWYVSSQSFANTASVTGGGNFGTLAAGAGGAEFMSLIYDSAAANWLTLDFTGSYNHLDGTTTTSGALALGSAAESDLSGMITGFGLYRNATGQNARWDSFQIEGILIPEPSSLALFGLGGLGVLLFRRRS
jgi:hypothetical protein